MGHSGATSAKNAETTNINATAVFIKPIKSSLEVL